MGQLIERLKALRPVWWALTALVVLQLATLAVGVWTLRHLPRTTIDVRVNCSAR